MSTVLLIIQLIISIILTGLILIQRSEGGALGIGGGGGGGFMSGKSAANSVSRMTGILGAAFILNCLLLSIVFQKENQDISLIDDSNAVESLSIEPEVDALEGAIIDESVTLETESSDETVTTDSVPDAANSEGPEDEDTGTPKPDTP